MQRSLDTPFIERNVLTTEIREALSPKGRHALLIGKSGSGKTRLAKEAINRHIEINGTSTEFILAIDGNQDHLDEFSDIESLIFQCWKPTPYKFDVMSAIPNKTDFESFVKRREQKQSGIRLLKSSILSALCYIPNLGEVVQQTFASQKTPHGNAISQADAAFLFEEYVDFVCKKCPITLVVDNAQAVANRLLNVFVKLATRHSDNISLLAIIRTTDDEAFTHTLDVFRQLNKISIFGLEYFSWSETYQLMEENFPSRTETEIHELSDQCFKTTGGNLRQIEQYLLNKKLFGGAEDNVQSPWFPNESAIEETLSHLTYVERQIVFLTALYPEGLNLRFVQPILSRLADPQEVEDLRQLISFVSECRLVKLNGPGKRILKPNHEQVVLATKYSFSDDEILEIRRHCVAVFENMAKTSRNTSEFVTSMNALLGVASFEELKQALRLCQDMIENLAQNDRYEQVAWVVDRVREIEKSVNSHGEVVSKFTESTLVMILKSLQRTSNFDTGRRILEDIKSEGRLSEQKREIWRAKFDAQVYQYQSAADALYPYLDVWEAKAAYLNCIQHIRCDLEAYNIVKNMHRPERQDNLEFYYIIVRNAYHVMDEQQAEMVLPRAENFFNSIGAPFLAATVANNYGLFLLTKSKPNLEAALSKFEKARCTLSRLGSKERYQAIFNIGSIHALSGNFIKARRFYYDSLLLCPENLEYDRSKFRSTHAILGVLAGIVTIDDAIGVLSNEMDVAARWPDPWLLYHVRANMSALHQWSKEVLNEPRERLEALIKAHELKFVDKTRYSIWLRASSDSNITFNLAPSPHWRH